VGVRLYEHGIADLIEIDGRCGMVRGTIKRWSGKHCLGMALLLTVVAAMPVRMLAQAEDGTPFAGGQMVRGTVTAATADRLTVKTESGEVYQVAVSVNTRLTKDRQPMKVAEIKVGDGVGAMGVMDEGTKTIHAVFVGVMDAEQVKKVREGLGKIFITGKVTAVDMDALKVTVMRPDGVSQVIGVDEGTSFKRGGRGMAAVVNSSGDAGGGGKGESITLADVKVGDSVAGRGALKNGLFVPTELGVIDPAAAGQRRRRRADGDGAPTGSAAAGAPK
jgi:hypothetical protein